LLARAPEIKQNKRRENLIEFAEQARISRRLVQLKDDVPIDRDLDSFALQVLDVARVTAFLREQGFKSVVARIESRHGVAPAAADAPKKEVEYELVQDEAALSRWIAAAVKSGQVAFDTETTGLDAMRAGLVGVSMSVAPGHACYVPLAHKSAREQGAFDLGDGGGSAGEEAPTQVPRDRALELLKPMLEDPSVLKIGHNIKYDALLLLRYGIDINPVDDTMLLSFVLDGGVHGHGMDELALLHLDHSCISFKDVAGRGRNQITFDYVPLKAACDYAA